MNAAGVLLLGDSRTAWKAARLLVSARVPVTIAAFDPALSPPPDLWPEAEEAPLEVLAGTRLLSCKGAAGDFEVRLAARGGILVRRARAVVVALPDRKEPLFPDYGLAPGRSVRSLSEFHPAELPPVAAGSVPPVVVFLEGLSRESRPEAAGRVMAAALELAARGSARSFVLCGNLKVAAGGLEALAHRARVAGVRFFKFDRERPALRVLAGGKTEIRFIDPASGEAFLLAADLVVADEARRCPAEAEEIARLLGLEADPAGFLQSENVHRLPVYTNRRGILVAGPGRDPGADPAVDAANAALAVLEGLAREDDPQTAAAIDPGRCIRCLTCLRLCAYRAVALDAERPRVLPAACERCGVCAAECPREAIRLEGFDRPGLDRLLASGPPRTGAPRITVFACSRSAAPALREACAAGFSPAAELRLIEIPCAGALAPETIRRALNAGSDGVLVLTCHEGNCHSRHGNRLALQRAEESRAFLERAQLDGARLAWGTLAANMPGEAQAAVSRLAAHLAGAAPGPSGPAARKET
ncbi:MAG: hydrogenase iron-sulfur subunit [Desulfobacterales bacterium]